MMVGLRAFTQEPDWVSRHLLLAMGSWEHPLPSLCLNFPIFKLE